MPDIFDPRQYFSPEQLDYASGKTNLPPRQAVPVELAQYFRASDLADAQGVFNMGPNGPIPTEQDFNGTILVPEQKTVCIGCDPGQQSDPFAISVVRMRISPLWECDHSLTLENFEPEPPCDQCKEAGKMRAVKTGPHPVQRLGEPRFEVVQSEILPLKTNHTVALARINQVFQNATVGEGIVPELVMDVGGIGRVIADLAREQFRLPVTGVLMTGGNSPSLLEDGHTLSIPKSHIVGALDGVISVSPRMLSFPPNMPNWQSLLTELTSFSQSVTPSGAVTFAARAGSHDDRVCSIAYCVYRLSPRERHTGVSIIPLGDISAQGIVNALSQKDFRSPY